MACFLSLLLLLLVALARAFPCVVVVAAASLRQFSSVWLLILVPLSAHQSSTQACQFPPYQMAKLSANPTLPRRGFRKMMHLAHLALLPHLADQLGLVVDPQNLKRWQGLSVLAVLASFCVWDDSRMLL